MPRESLYPADTVSQESCGKRAPLLHFGLCAHTFVYLWQSPGGPRRGPGAGEARGGLHRAGFGAARPTPGPSPACMSRSLLPLVGFHGRLECEATVVRALPGGACEMPLPAAETVHGYGPYRQRGPRRPWRRRLVCFILLVMSYVRDPRGSPSSCKRGRAPRRAGPQEASALGCQPRPPLSQPPGRPRPPDRP